MTTTEKLNRINEICTANLEIASARTLGKWIAEKDLSGTGGILAVEARDHVMLYRGSYLQKEDASFIASCAGPAEAGWRATIAAIDWLLELSENDPSWLDRAPTSKAIISAWEDQL